MTETTASRKNAVTYALLDALALLLVDSEERLAKSSFREFLENNEFALALEELNEVVRNDNER